MKDPGKTLVALAATILLPLSASADVIEWSINVDLISGGSISGTYNYDADTDEFSDISVSATGGLFPPSSASLTDVLVDFSGPTGIDLVPGVADLTGFEDVYIELASAMTNAGGIIEVSLVQQYLCFTATCDFLVLLAEHDVFAGRATVEANVPEPAVIGLLGLGLVAIGMRRRRSKT